jgi:hypothetical protein
MDQGNAFPLFRSDSPTVTIVGVSNMAGTDIEGMSSVQSVTSCSIPADVASRSRPLSEGAVRVGNSLLNARVPEANFLRDHEDL